MLEAIHASTTSAVLIHGKLSEAISLKWSLWHGCPLSPLLFIIVANALSTLLTEAADAGLIKGVPIKETDKAETHNQFVDDIV